MGQSNSIHEEQHPSSSEEEEFQRRQSAHIALNDPTSIGSFDLDLRQRHRQTENIYSHDSVIQAVNVIREKLRSLILSRRSILGKNGFEFMQRYFLKISEYVKNNRWHRNAFEMEELSKETIDQALQNQNVITVEGLQIDGTAPALNVKNCITKLSLEELTTTSENTYLDLTFLVDDNTITWIKSNHVMFILRGLPGSGKTTLAKSLKNVYAKNALGDFIFCSADNFFMTEGLYNYDCTKLKSAHEECQHEMKEAAICRIQTIVVDNTNIMFEEMKPYFQTANHEGYIVLIVEPKTPWRFNPNLLAKKNNHGVSKEFLEERLKMYRSVIPLYYGWFLSVYDSRRLIKLSREILKMCLLTCEKFNADFKDFSLISDIDRQVDYYETPNRKCFSNTKSRLHCTAKYCGKLGEQKEIGLFEYASRDIVKSSIGQLTTLDVIGFVITKSTFGARLQLSDTQLMLYDQEEFENVDISKNITDSSFEYVGAEESKNLENMYLIEKTTNFCPVSGKGQKAHITVGTACGVSAVQTGIDVLKAVEYEKCSSIEKLYYNIFTFQIPDTSFVLRRYQKDLWVLYRSSENILFDALFTGYYA